MTPFASLYRQGETRRKLGLMLVIEVDKPLWDPAIIHPEPPASRITHNRPPIPERKTEDLGIAASAEEQEHLVFFDYAFCKVVRHGAYVHPTRFSSKIWEAILELDDSVEESEASGALVLRTTTFPISNVFGELAEGESIDTISQSFGLDRTSLSAMLRRLASLIDFRSRRHMVGRYLLGDWLVSRQSIVYDLEPEQQSSRDAAADQKEHEDARQREIDRLRAAHQVDFDRIEAEMPSLDELLSICTEPPPREWLDERWP